MFLIVPAKGLKASANMPPGKPSRDCLVGHRPQRLFHRSASLTRKLLIMASLTSVDSRAARPCRASGRTGVAEFW